MKDSKLRFPEELINEINDLKVRAVKIGYKNIIPKLPESRSNFEQSMLGFMYRLDNWKKQLLQLENPGGMLSGKKRPEPLDLLRQIVINYDEEEIINDDFSENN